MGAKGLSDTICRNDFRATMIKIAEFVGRTDFVTLSEAPADPTKVIVTVTRGGAAEALPLARVTDCATEDGYQLDGARISFCGNAGPKAGDTVEVQASGERSTITNDAGVVGEECLLPEGERASN